VSRALGGVAPAAGEGSGEPDRIAWPGMAERTWARGPAAQAPGALIARLLAGAWRAPPPPLDLTADELARIAPLLFKSGAAALAWWRLRRSPLADSVTTRDLRQAYRLHTLDAELHAIRIAETLGRLEAAGVASLLVKGWAVARLYPEPGLRSYTDVDLIVPRGELARARAALAAGPPIGEPVDLHDGPGLLDLSSFDELAARAEPATVGGAVARVLGPEDHLRVLGLHGLRHGLFRPLWLVDLAVCVETRPAGFDWGRCLGADPRRAEWVAGAVALAHCLLDARLTDTPVAERAARLPRWLVRAVLRSWDRCEGVSHGPRVFQAFLGLLGQPGRLRDEVRLRWDRPIQATLDVNGPFNRLPRLPFQLAAAALRIPELIRAIPAGARRALRPRAVSGGPRSSRGGEPRRGRPGSPDPSDRSRIGS
jgi:Uncharacterised nucleotidyltransferase